MAAKAKKPAAKKPVKKVVVKKGEQRSRLEMIGDDAFCERVVKGESVGEIADSLDMARQTVWNWIEADVGRSARVRKCLESSAHAYDEMACQVLKDLKSDSTQADVSRARELASHYRWRASKRNPKTYGDKLDLNHSGKIDLTDEQVQTRLALLLAKAGVGNSNQGEA